MNGQRHKGYRVFSEYMTADTKQYRHNPLSKTAKIRGPTLDSIPEVGDGVDWHQLPSPKGLAGIPDVIALFMPVLAFEEHRPRKRMTKAIHKRLRELKTPGAALSRRPSSLDSSQMDESPNRDGNTALNAPVIDTSVIEAYLGHERPIHCRRTLDQYRYYMLETTASRDLDQVVYKWAGKQQKSESGGSGLGDKVTKAKNRPIIMVDQLWLWILPDGTVISSLPNTAYANEAYNIGCKLELAMFGGSDAPVQSVDDLVSVILKNCVDFFRRDGPCDFKFQDSFQYSINDVAEAEVKTYEIYKDAVTQLQKLKDSRRLRTLGQQYTETFSQITEETNRLVEVMDIQDELSIVDSVLKAQKTVLQKLVQKIGSKKAKKPDAAGHAKEIALQDAARVLEVIQIVDENISNVKEMGMSAKKVQDDLKQLLDFKQQQSSAWEMQYSMKLAIQGRKQNNIMLVFTLVTIVFLPMSFLSSFFAIGIQEFPTDANTGNVAWPIGELSAYLFGISLALCVPLLLAAFFVNDISRMARSKTKEDQLDEDGAVSGSLSVPDSDESDSDSDADRKTRNLKKKKDPITLGSEVREYALLFGYFDFHTKVPLVRQLWKNWPYRVEELEGLGEDLEWDYPLSRFRKRLVEPANEVLLRIGLRKLGAAYLNHERAYILDRTSDGLVKQLLKEKMELREQERQQARREADRMSEKSRSPGPRLRQGFGIRDALGGRRHGWQAMGEQV
ncbi:hypothetical protein B0T25DRAFT_238246 [Lasiosphaeria hispida]|uniref:Ankyrin repeat protein n=1 Tax=Lasiosphaeria hispida TaxID=260671 RepID=A0AAJ0HEQ4_9PEZI|nr:hypothetical protein B0T25DRAFT_238246 [Lasiosphaeria hispida]